jgi:multicomponent Na+:H+ antiporter subunit E
MALIAYAVGLVLIWVLAWGTPTPANLLSGLAVAAVLLAVSPDAWPPFHRVRLRPVAVARFLGFVLVEVVKANVTLTREVLSRESRITTGVVAVPLPECSDGLLTLVTNVMAVTPGTMPIEVTRHPTVIYVHVLLLGDVEAVRRDVRHLAALAYRAFGSAAAIAALDEIEREAAT